MVERETKQVRAVQIKSAKTPDLQDVIYATVQEGSHICTDSYSGYDVLNWNSKHDIVKHCVGEYVKIDSKTAFKIHTNSIEEFWSLLRRGINGTHHWVSKKHIQRYLNDFSFRYSNRELETVQIFESIFQNTNVPLTYKQLIA